MQVVVSPDHRARVVTHLVWYRVGAADERGGRARYRLGLRISVPNGHRPAPDKAGTGSQRIR
jgi:hypothetical protein